MIDVSKSYARKGVIFYEMGFCVDAFSVVNVYKFLFLMDFTFSIVIFLKTKIVVLHALYKIEIIQYSNKNSKLSVAVKIPAYTTHRNQFCNT